MKPETLERIACSLEAFDQRLSAIDTRFVKMESHIADDAQATDEASRAIATINGSIAKIQDLCVSLDEKMDQHIAVMQNFIRETQRLRRESQQLISEIRKKEAAVSGER